jgi:uncharacterized cupin superfamily protein
MLEYNFRERCRYEGSILCVGERTSANRMHAAVIESVLTGERRPDGDCRGFSTLRLYVR